MIAVARTDFIKALQLTSGIAKAHNTIPILSTAHVVANGVFAMEATDLDRFIRCEISYQGDAETFLLPSLNKLASAMRHVDSERVLLGKDDDGLTIEAGALSSTLRQTQHVDDHPRGEFVAEEDFAVDLGAAELAQLRRLMSAISIEETRYYLNGIAMQHIGDWTWRFYATDGHRLYLVDIPLPGAVGKIPDMTIIPRELLKSLFAEFTRTKELIRFSFGPKVNRNELPVPTALNLPTGALRIQFRSTLAGVVCTLAGKLIDGTYPDVTRVIPAESQHHAKVRKAELVTAIRTLCALSSEKTRAIKLSFAEGRCTLSLNSPEIGVSSISIEAEWIGRDPGLDIGFNARNLLDVLAVLHGEDVSFGLTDPGAPTVLLDPSDTTFKAILMPMRF